MCIYIYRLTFVYMHLYNLYMYQFRNILIYLSLCVCIINMIGLYGINAYSLSPSAAALVREARLAALAQAPLLAHGGAQLLDVGEVPRSSERS